MPVSLDDAKQNMRVDQSEDDVLIVGLIAAATKHLEGVDGLLGRALVAQSYELRLDAWSARIALPIAPVISVTAVRYRDAAGVLRTLSPSRYQATGLGSTYGSEVRPAVGTCWPETDRSAECITIEFRAGYGDDRYSVPADIRQAILLHVSAMYLNREATAPTDIGALPFGYDELIANHRLRGFG
jgi:uncharacterized phiE125 gp8 family phage protein